MGLAEGAESAENCVAQIARMIILLFFQPKPRKRTERHIFFNFFCGVCGICERFFICVTLKDYVVIFMVGKLIVLIPLYFFDKATKVCIGHICDFSLIINGHKCYHYIFCRLRALCFTLPVCNSSKAFVRLSSTIFC